MRYSRKQQKIAGTTVGPFCICTIFNVVYYSEGPVDSPPFYGKNILQPPNAALIMLGIC